MKVIVLLPFLLIINLFNPLVAKAEGPGTDVPEVPKLCEVSESSLNLDSLSPESAKKIFKGIEKSKEDPSACLITKVTILKISRGELIGREVYVTISEGKVRLSTEEEIASASKDKPKTPPRHSGKKPPTTRF